VFDVFISSYCYALGAVLVNLQAQVKVQDIYQGQLELYSHAKRLADQAQQDFRKANDKRSDKIAADSLAVQALATLQERY